jgi:hypothetical protein
LFNSSVVSGSRRGRGCIKLPIIYAQYVIFQDQRAGGVDNCGSLAGIGVLLGRA